MKRKEISIAINCYYIVISMFIVFILAMMVLYLPNMRAIDYNIIHSVQGVMFNFPTRYAKFISYFGCGSYWLWPRLVAASVMVSHKYYMKAFLFLIFTRVIFIVNDIWVKGLVCRERPCGHAYPGYSFPSGHAAFTMCMYGILIYLVYRYVRTDWWRTLLITLFTIWIILVCISRMWLNVHFLTDVTAGLFMGFIMVNLYIILDKFFSN